MQIRSKVYIYLLIYSCLVWQKTILLPLDYAFLVCSVTGWKLPIQGIIVEEMWCSCCGAPLWPPGPSPHTSLPGLLICDMATSSQALWRKAISYLLSLTLLATQSFHLFKFLLARLTSVQAVKSDNLNVTVSVETYTVQSRGYQQSTN